MEFYAKNRNAMFNEELVVFRKGVPGLEFANGDTFDQGNATTTYNHTIDQGDATTTYLHTFDEGSAT